MYRSVIRGAGSYLPEKIVTNDDLSAFLDTSDAWIQQRTGIHSRRIAEDDEYTSHLGIAAAREALENGGVSAGEIDLIVVATSTPDNTFPATAVHVQRALEIKQGMAFDVQAVCSGFVYALTVADQFLRTGQSKKALVIGAETFSRILDWTDRTTCVLFGDGAGAVVLEGQASNGNPQERGVISNRLRSDGIHWDKLYVDGGPSTTKTVGHLRMRGRDVFRHAVELASEVIDGVMEDGGITIDDVDWFVPHQANKRIIDATAKKLGLADEKIIVTVQGHANTSAASIPLALAEGVNDGRIKKGDLVLLEALGGGFTWGASLIRW